jgi:hypothetical protein
MITGYNEKFVKDLNERDRKVAVSGIVIEKSEGGIVVDDGSGCVQVEIETDVSEGKFVRIFGFLVWDGKKVEVKGNVLQELSDADRKIYDAVKKLISKNT